MSAIDAQTFFNCIDAGECAIESLFLYTGFEGWIKMGGCNFGTANTRPPHFIIMEGYNVTLTEPFMGMDCGISSLLTDFKE